MDAQKKIDTETLVGMKLIEDTFIDLCNIAKTLSDYAVEGDYALN